MSIHRYAVKFASVFITAAPNVMVLSPWRKTTGAALSVAAPAMHSKPWADAAWNLPSS
ncbi:MAG: hypothetical protein ACOYMG_26745 [Candidatus Methylumidiphilus sp.]